MRDIKSENEMVSVYVIVKANLIPAAFAARMISKLGIL